MDLSKIKSNVDQGKYGQDRDAAGKFYSDLLMFDNCCWFNGPDNYVMNEATQVMKFVPEIYAEY